ncbi:MAG: hypothetical protein NWE94_07185 [Candidatus Bathyarchaeota archaeon]|nr:hypothetical protein [Candidatus Bathyarchaeota archaeon]
MGNKVNENCGGRVSRLESIKNRFSKTARKELGDEIEADDKVASVFLIVVNGLFGLYFIAHQTVSTGFFTPRFSAFEIVMLYGIFVYWIVTSVLILIGQRNPSRDLDSFGGLFFATFAFGWLIVIFPFEFAHFADALPDVLRFLVQWISNEIALVFLILLFIAHLIFAVYSLVLRLYVRKARKMF